MLSAAFFAAAAALAWLAASRSTGVQPPAAGMKRLSGTVAERLVYRVPSEPFPRASCDACRMGRLKAGPFSLGAFNVVEFDDLVVNIPPGGLGGNAEEHGNATLSGSSFAEALNLKPLVGMSQSQGGGRKMKFHGIKINGFALNKMEGRELVPIASAATVRNSRRTIVLQDVVLRRNGAEERIAEAKLELKPRVAIVWPGGIWDLGAAISSP